MSLDPLLLRLLACPIDKQALVYLAEDDVLYNPRLRRIYPIREDIPVMLADQAEAADDTRHKQLLGQAAAIGATATLDASLFELLAPHTPGSDAFANCTDDSA